VLEESPSVYKNSTNVEFGGYSGLAIDYLMQLQNNLHFNCNIIGYQTLPGKTNAAFTSFVLDFGACTATNSCTCDMGVGGWATTQEVRRFISIT
jgi:hypothetical protein